MRRFSVILARSWRTSSKACARSVLPWQQSGNPLYSILEFSQFSVLVGQPENLGVNSMVGMTKVVANIRNLAPFDVWFSNLELVRNMSGSFAQNF